MHAEQQRSCGADCVAVVGRVRAVGCAHLPQDCAGTGQNIGYSKRAADLDQFPAGDEHFTPERQRVQGQQHRGGVVVDHRGRPGADDLLQQATDVVIAVTAPSGVKVEFQCGGAAQRACGSRGSFRRQRSAAEIGVEHGASQVEDGSLGRGELLRECRGGAMEHERGWARPDRLRNGALRVRRAVPRGLRSGRTG